MRLSVAPDLNRDIKDVVALSYRQNRDTVISNRSIRLSVASDPIRYIQDIVILSYRYFRD